MALHTASRLTLPAVTSAVRGSAQLSELLRPFVASFHGDARYRTWWNHIQRQDHDADFFRLPSVALPEPASLLMRSFGHPAPMGLLGPLMAAGLLQRTAARPFPSDFTPASGVDIQEHEKQYEISADCPGMGEGDVAVELSPDKTTLTLTLSGTRTTGRPRPATPSAATASASASASAAPSDSKHDNAHGAAAAAAAAGEAVARGNAGGGSGGVRSYSFRRSFLLPDDVDVEGVSARLDKGVLSVTLPRRKVPQPQPLRVPVHAAASGSGK